MKSENIHPQTDSLNKIQFMTNINLYMFRHGDAILRESFRSKQYNKNNNV
jgi:hypothetical protein